LIVVSMIYLWVACIWACGAFWEHEPVDPLRPSANCVPPPARSPNPWSKQINLHELRYEEYIPLTHIRWSNNPIMEFEKRIFVDQIFIVHI
jgi:hypothetical protein